MENNKNTLITRRNFLTGALSCGITSLFPYSVEAKLPSRRGLILQNANTKDIFHQIYYSNGYSKRAHYSFSWVMRDWRENKTIVLHPWLMDVAYILQQKYRIPQIISTSGYRTEKTNAIIKGAAKNSLHMKGMALDIALPDYLNGENVIDFLRPITTGGLGYYPKKHFIHVDMGEKREWIK